MTDTARPPLDHPDRPRSSSGNGCPFLRALVAEELLPNEPVSIRQLSRTVVKVARAGDPTPVLPERAVPAIALVASGLSLIALLRSLLRGVDLDRLRDGPLDKHGAGSRILDDNARIDPGELDRMASFGSPKNLPDGTSELGLDAQEIATWMDANFARAEGHRRAVDRRLMDGEWPVLLQALGKEGTSGRFLAVSDVRRLIVEERLPQRITDRLS